MEMKKQHFNRNRFSQEVALMAPGTPEVSAGSIDRAEEERGANISREQIISQLHRHMYEIVVGSLK